MTKAVSAWALRFFGKGLGYDNVDLSKYREDFIQRQYEGFFLEPLTEMCGNLDAVTINTAVTHMNNRAPMLWPYILSYIVETGIFVNTGNFTKDFDNAIRTLHDKYKTGCATADPKVAKDIPVLLDEEGAVVGHYPVNLFAYPSYVITHGNGRYVRDLLTKNLLTISDYDKELLINLLELGMLNDSDTMVTCTIPAPNGTFETITAPLSDYRIPPTTVLNLINNLPTSLIAEHNGDSYQALRYYALTSEVPEIVTWYLNDIIASHFDDTSSTTVEQTVFPPTVSDENMNSTDYFSGTLDELIDIYCKENSIDKRCTIQQLVDHIDHLPTIEPVSIQEQVAIDRAERNLSGETTLNEYIANTPHVYVDDVDVALSCIVGNPCIPVELQEALKHCLLTDEPLTLPKQEVDYNSVLASVGLPETMSTEITDAIVGKRPVDVGKFDTELAVRQFQQSPFIDASMLELITTAQKSKSVLSLKDAFLHYLPELQLDNDTLSRMTIAARTGAAYEPAPPKVIEQPLKRTVYDEEGYNAGEILLRATREAISKDASFEVREKYTAILYTFLRLLMCDLKTEREDVKEFLLNKMKGVDSATAEIIQKALSEIK